MLELGEMLTEFKSSKLKAQWYISTFEIWAKIENLLIILSVLQT